MKAKDIVHDLIGFAAFVAFIVLAIKGNTHWMVFCGLIAICGSIETSIRNA